MKRSARCAMVRLFLIAGTLSFLFMIGCQREESPARVDSNGTKEVPTADQISEPADDEMRTETAASPDDASSDESWQTITSNNGTYRVAYRIRPAEIPVNETFSVDVRILHADADSPDPICAIALDMDARMPDHRHGMLREPVITQNDDCSFTVEGMQFHMLGYWELYFDMTAGAVTERAQISATLEE